VVAEPVGFAIDDAIIPDDDNDRTWRLRTVKYRADVCIDLFDPGRIEDFAGTAPCASPNNNVTRTK
jgi:hypothetical protein